MKKSRKILITGGNGIVGSYMTVGVRLSHSDLNVTNLSEVEKVVRNEKPSVVIHLAAVTDMKRCEENPDFAYKVNMVGTYNVALVAREVGAKVVYVSTNAVFDGKKDSAYLPIDIPRPVNVYGHSKYMGELAVLGINSKNLVVRTSWVFGGGKSKDKKFVGKIMPKLRSNEAFSAVNDVKGTPTYAGDLATALQKLTTSDISGIIHMTNSGNASRYDMTMAMREFSNSKSIVSPAPLSSFESTGNTLKNETLNSGSHVLRSWREALEQYVKAEW